MKSFKEAFILLVFFLCQIKESSFGQCSVSSARPPANVSETSLSGSNFDWNDASDVLTSNNDYAYAGATLTLLNPIKYSDYLTMTNFSMAIPTAVTICGIEVQMDRKASGLSLGAVVKDYRVRLVKAGSITGNNKAYAGGWSGSETTVTYGGSSDLWGTTWTPTDINSGNFGFAFSTEISGLLGVFLSADVDNVRITVYYQHIILPVSISAFKGTQKGNSVELTWETKAENGIKTILVERQLSHSSWETVQEIHDFKTTNQQRTFYAYDHQPQATNNYRLKIIDNNNNTSYSETTSIKLDRSMDDLFLCVNSSNKSIMLLASEPIILGKVFRPDGTHLYTVKNPSNNNLSISVNDLPEGNLIILVETRRKRMSRHIYVRK